MRRLLILSCCLLFSACAGNRTLDGETTKNWVKIVSSKTDKSGDIQDVCYIFDLSFYPESVYERLENNPNTCLEECCWYSENKSVDFYFNDGFVKDLQENGTSRRYNPDHIRVNMTYAPFLNRLSARASSPESISREGIVMLEYEDISKPEFINNESLSEVKAKDYSKEASVYQKEKKEPVSYKTTSISGLNRQELLARAQHARDEYYEDEDADYEEEEVEFRERVPSKNNVARDQRRYKYSSEEAEDQEDLYEDESNYSNEQVKSSKQKINIRNKADGAMYDVQRTRSQEAKIVYVDPVMPEPVDEDTLNRKLAYERGEAVKLLKRFYGDDIDSHLRALDKSKKQKGQVLFINNKVWQAQKIGTIIYKITCSVKGEIVFLDSDGFKQTKDYPIACGVYIVDLDEKTVEAKDDLAQKIAKNK